MRQPSPTTTVVAPTQHLHQIVRWIVDRLHVATTETQIVRDFRHRMVPDPKHPRGFLRTSPSWTKEDRKAIYRYALQCHRENRLLYGTVAHHGI